MGQPRKPKGAPGGTGGRYDIILATTGATPPPPPDLSGRIITGVAGPLDFTRTRLEDARWEQVNAARSRLAGANMARLKAFDCDLQESDLTGADLEDAVLFDCRLDRACLDRARLQGADIRRSTLMAASGRNLRLNGANIMNCDWAGASLNDTSLDSASLDGVRLDNADLTRATLVGTTVGACSLEKTCLDNVLCEYTRLSDTTVSPSSARAARFRYVRLAGCDCSEPALDEADWADVTARDCDFCGRRLTGLTGENRLVGCDLRGADLTGAQVVSLSGCDLRGARLDGVDPSDCDFRDAVVTAGQAERYGLASRGVVVVR